MGSNAEVLAPPLRSNTCFPHTKALVCMLNLGCERAAVHAHPTCEQAAAEAVRGLPDRQGQAAAHCGRAPARRPHLPGLPPPAG